MEDIIENMEATLRKVDDNVEESRTVTFVASTDAKDRHGTVLNQSNWNIKNFNNNPIIGYQHNVYGGDMCNAPNPDDQLGKAKAYFETTKKGTNEEKRELLVDITFEPESINPKAEKIFRKVLHGSLKAVSVGFIPLKDKDGNKGVYGRTDTKGNITDSDTYFYVGQELLEVSVVNIPSNPEALKKSLRSSSANALTYIAKTLGKRYSEIEEMKVRDILDILDGKEDKTDTSGNEEEVIGNKEVINNKETPKEFCKLQEKELLLATKKRKL